MADVDNMRWLQGWKRWLWPLVTVARLHRLRSVHLRPKDSTWDSVNKKEACSCSLQMVIMIKSESWQRLLAFAKCLHIKRQHGGCMQSCSCIPKVWVGSVGEVFLDGFDCFKWLTAQRLRQIYSNSEQITGGPGLKLLLLSWLGGLPPRSQPVAAKDFHCSASWQRICPLQA